PVLRDLQREVGWPTNFAVFHVDSMVVRETSHHLSPFSCHRILAGIVLPVLHTAIGQAYFSFCSEDERAQILRVLQSSKVADSTLAANDPYIAEMVRTTRARGYSVSPGLFKPRRQLEARSVSAIAVPVFMHGRVAGAVNIVFFAKAISATSAAEKYLPLLRRAAKLIEARSTALSELSWDGVAAQPMLAVHPAGAAMAPHGPDRLAVPPGEGGALLPRSLQASAVATRCPPAR
ncbi:MAG: IclR family transcriptional regulator C-terminal domain-containing protein, partial [Alphaproteobacteria bacterium]